MKTIKLAIISMQLLADGKAAILTKVSKENPSENGVHVLNAGQVKRLAIRTLGVNSPIGLKHIIDMTNGSASLEILAEECKVGAEYENKATGEKGRYGFNADGTPKPDAKDWTKYSNHEIKLGVAGSMKLAELSLSSAFANVEAQPVVAKPVVAESNDAPTV